MGIEIVALIIEGKTFRGDGMDLFFEYLSMKDQLIG